MCEACREHKDVDCAAAMIAKARPDQLRKLLRDILRTPRPGPDGAAA